MNWRRLLARIGVGRRKPASLTACPTCGREMIMVERTTFSGSDMRSYTCERCGGDHVMNFGTALWKLYADAYEEREKRDAG